MTFEWDEIKNKINDRKHGVLFEEAQVIWADLHALEFTDEDHSSVEERYIKIGLNPVKGILLVVFCERVNDSSEESIRIISARKATINERQVYEERL